MSDGLGSVEATHIVSDGCGSVEGTAVSDG